MRAQSGILISGSFDAYGQDFYRPLRAVNQVEFDPVKVFKALANKTRYELFEQLLRGDISTCCDRICIDEGGACVTDAIKRFGLAQSTISYHLMVLEEAGLIWSEKRGLWTCYFPNREVLDALGRLFLDGDVRHPGGC